MSVSCLISPAVNAVVTPGSKDPIELAEETTHVVGKGGAQRLGSCRPRPAPAQQDRGDRLLVGGIQHSHKIVATLSPVISVHSATRVLDHLSRLLGALHGNGGVLDTLLSSSDRGDRACDSDLLSQWNA